MSVRGTTSWFNLYDLLTSIAPGATIITALALYISPSISAFNAVLTPAAGVVFIVISFIIGEFITFAVASIYHTPVYFRTALREVHDGNIELTVGDRVFGTVKLRSTGFSAIFTETKEEFWSLFRDQFGVSDDFDTPSEIFLILTNYLGANLGHRTNRYRMMSQFCLNMIGALLLTIVIYLYFLKFGQENQTVSRSIGYILVFGFFPFIIMFLTFAQRSFEKEYVKLLFMEYYIDQSGSRNTADGENGDTE